MSAKSMIVAAACLGLAAAVTPQYSTCTVDVSSAGPQYNAAWGCPVKCQVQNCGNTYLAPQGSSITRDNTPVWCSGVDYYYSSYYNFNGQLESGYIAGVYLKNCGGSIPPPAPMAMAANEVAAPAPAPQEASVQQQRRRQTPGPYPQKQCQVPSTASTYELTSTQCIKEVTINAGSVVVDMGDSIVYSSACQTSFVRVEYMLMGGEIGYGYMRSQDIKC